MTTFPTLGEGPASPSPEHPKRGVGRITGSVFAGSVVHALTSTSSPLLESRQGHQQGASDSRDCLQPQEPTHLQTWTYNALCRSILDVCSDKRKNDMDPSPSNPSFSESAGPLATVTAGGETVDKMTELICQKRLEEMVDLFLATCPGDWFCGFGPLVRGQLCRALDDEAEMEDLDQAFATICFRWEQALLADYLVEKFGLPVPGQQICILWNREEWVEKEHRGEFPQYRMVWHMLVAGDFIPFPLSHPDQRPQFDRPCKYIAAAVALKELPEDETRALVKSLLEYIDGARAFEQQRAMKDPEVQACARNWFRELGRRIRD